MASRSTEPPQFSDGSLRALDLYGTTILPFMPPCSVQWKFQLPAVVKVRDCEPLVIVPMFVTPGEIGASKTTSWVTPELFSKATVAPLDMLSSAGSKLAARDRKSTRLNSSHSQISYAVFCLKKKKNINR